MSIHTIRCYGFLMALVALSHPAGRLSAQGGGVIDEGVFVITRGSALLGREEFVVRRGRTGAPTDGFTITATASYPAARPTRRVTTKVELAADSQPTLAEFHDRDGENSSAFIRLAGRRVTVRRVTPSGESVREYPRRARTLIHDDRVFAVYTILPGSGAGSLSVLQPITDRRFTTQLTDHGIERIRVKGVERPLRHISLQSGDGGVHHLWFDERGRLIEVSIPAQNVKAVRESS